MPRTDQGKLPRYSRGKKEVNWIDWKVRTAVPDDAPTIVKLAQEVKDYILPYALSEVSVRNYIYRWVVVYNSKTKEIGGAEHSIPNLDVHPADLVFMEDICQMSDEAVKDFLNTPSKILKAQPICPGKGTLRALIDWQKENYEEVWIWLSVKSTIRDFCIKNGIAFEDPVCTFLNVWKGGISNFSVGKWKRVEVVEPQLSKLHLFGQKKPLSAPLGNKQIQELKAQAGRKVKELFPVLSSLVPGDYIVIKGPLGSGKTLVAETIKEWFSSALGLKFRILDGFEIPEGLKSPRQVELYMGDSIKRPLQAGGEVGILVYQSLGRSDTLIKSMCMGIITPTLTLDGERSKLSLSTWWSPNLVNKKKPWYETPLEDNSVSSDERLSAFSCAMKDKWAKGASKYGPVFATDPVAEAMEECVDLALYAKVLYFRLDQLRQKKLD